MKRKRRLFGHISQDARVSRKVGRRVGRKQEKDAGADEKQAKYPQWKNPRNPRRKKPGEAIMKNTRGIRYGP